MSGELVVLGGDAQGRVAAYVRTLGQLPTRPRWILVGGLAVNVRLGKVHRATNDVDTVSGNQPGLIELMVAGDAERLSAAKVRFRASGVEVDVMESTEGSRLPIEQSDRVFALVRRWAMRTAGAVILSATDPSGGRGRTL